MKLPNSAVVEFQALYKKKFGKELPFGEAEKRAAELIILFALSKGKNDIL